MIDSGNATAGIQIERGDCRKTKTTAITSTTAIARVRPGIVYRGIDRLRAVHGDVEANAVRQRRLDRGQELADLGIGRDDVGASVPERR